MPKAWAEEQATGQTEGDCNLDCALYVPFELSYHCTRSKEVQLNCMLTVRSSAWVAQSECFLLTMVKQQGGGLLGKWSDYNIRSLAKALL